MYSLIIKITHSLPAKDTIAVVRGLYRVATGPLQSNPNYSNRSWMQKPIQKPIPSDHEEEIPSKGHKDKERKIYLENFRQLQNTKQKYIPTESHIPASRIGRFFQFGKLGVNLFSASFMAGNDKDDSYYEKIGQQISNQLCKMRGAPLKLAQMLSIQEDSLIPAPIRKAFEKARQSAHVIPLEQVKFMLENSFGNNWRQKFVQFSEKPFASASIGQVHKGVIEGGDEVAVKVQYKAVKRSINSDIDNLSFLAKIPKLFPKTMYIERILQKAKQQLILQCDYKRQKKHQELYSVCLEKCLPNQAHLFKVPKVYSDYTTDQIFTSEYLSGIKLSDIQSNQYSQQLKDQIGRRIMLITFKELFEMGIMQSDPNPSNFTYNPHKDQLNLFDFGATHMYKFQFLSEYYNIIQGSVKQDYEQIWNASIKTGFVTGQQNSAMKNSHIQSILIVGQPLRFEGRFDFSAQNITERIYKTIPLMLKNRLKPPPEEIYSLHRKLSGSYLACIRLGARVNCHQIFKEIRFQALAKQYQTNEI